MYRLALSICGVALFLASALHAGDIGFVEDFALAKDRTEALKKLIPGTEDYYYFHCLHYLNSAQYDKAVALFKPWGERFGQTQRLTEIQTRHALLTYEKNPEQSINYFKTRLGLNFFHQKIVQGGAPNLPTSLDPKVISRERMAEYARVRAQQGADIYEDSSLDWILTNDLDISRRRTLLSRLQRPDIPNLPKIVADDLNTQHSGGFGSMGIHHQLTLAQLQELLKLKPELLNQQSFVQAWTLKLHPNDDEDWRHDSALLRAYLDRLLTFARKLSPVFNAYKAHVLFHRLVLDQSQGTRDKEIFVEYLKLPRFQGYMSSRMLDANIVRQPAADLNANYLPITLLPNIGTDEAIVRDYLKYFLADAKSPREYEPYINDVYLKHLFAEMQIENGSGDPETLASQLPPELFRQIKERIDIEFAFTNKTSYAVDEPVSLELFVKNVPNLMVKVFEVNTTNFYRFQKRPVDTAINLDGLVTNSEKSYAYDAAPFLRVGRKFEFPQINKPGVYVVDFIGNGKSSRALIRKGQLRALVGMSTAGQKLTIIDQSDRIVQGATVWLGTQEYKSDEKGVVLVPFSTTPGRHPIIISKGEFASLDFLDHQAETYNLVAGIHVDRESLITQRVAELLVRPSLRLNGIPVSVKLLEDVRLVITATDQDGIMSSTQVTDFKLFEDRESVHEFRVPARLSALHIALQAKVKSLSTGKDVMLAASEVFGLNNIRKTDKIEDMHFAKFGNDYAIEVLGRTGEAKPDRPVQLTIKHRDFREAVTVMLKSDANGRIKLGTLTDITNLTAMGPEGISHQWTLPVNQHTHRAVFHAQEGEPIAIPYLGASDKADRSELALFELRGNSNYADRFAAMTVKGGTIELTGLTAGDYDMWLKSENQRVRIRVVKGKQQAGYVLGKLRHLQLPALKPVQVADIATDNDNVTIQLRDFSSFTRVHVYATRYLPTFSAFTDLGKVRDVGLDGAFPLTSESLYLAGRNIGDEYRYVLDRRNQKKYPGNMLERPALLLNPWVVRSTESGEQLAQAGEDYKKMLKEAGGERIPAQTPPAMPAPGWNGQQGGGDFADLDFLYDPAATLHNLTPDKNGVVKISRKAIGPHSMICVVAVDPVNTTARSISLPEQKADFVDLRLRNGLDPKGHFTQQKQVNVLQNGQAMTIADAAASRFETYDSLAKVYGLYSTLTHDPKLAEFSFILTWPTLKLAEKQVFYSKFACHELSFFIARKDPDFFKTVVKPYLANKKDKTFLDHWLLESDLRDYLQPWKFDRLNSVERILLAQRLAGESAHTARHLNDLYRLLPPDMERSRMLYETALKASNLGLGGKDKRELDRLHEDQLLRLGDVKEKLDKGSEAAKFDPSSASRPTSGDGSGFGIGGAGAGPGKGSLGRREGRSPVKMELAEKAARDATDELKVEAKVGDGETNGIPQTESEQMFFELARTGKDAPARLYRKVDLTQELAENNYYKLPIQQQIGNLVSVNSFWVDYARHDGKSPFLTANVADASRNFTEMMFALSVLDLPFIAAKHQVKFDAGRMTFVPGSNVLAFHEEVKPAGMGDKVQILVSQNFYRNGDRYRDENGERYDKFVTEEFVIHTVYGCQIVVTNPTPSRQRLSVLTQIPAGAIAVNNGQPTKTVWLDLEPYRTQIVDYQFYFPRAGQFDHFPVHVAKAEALVAMASPFHFNVVEKPTKLDTESWEYVSQNGSEADVLAFMNRENIHALDLEKIAFRMKDRVFFETVIHLVEERHAYHPTLWSYGLYHNMVPVAREYLTHVDQMVNECGGPIVSPLLVIDPVIRHQYEHLEYKPLINARAHALGQNRQIVNARFNEQYHHMLHNLTYRGKLSNEELLAVTYYLLLQDRVDEAQSTFAQIKADTLATRMQYDYCAAYLDMFTDDPRKVRALVATYSNHPVERWRNAFAAIRGQLDEIEGKSGRLVDKDDQAQQQAALAAKEPSFEFGVANKNINLTWKNIDTVRINYYLMDVELLFSRNPFVQQGSSQFSQIRPNETATLTLPKINNNKLAIPLPDSLADKNVLVEITANGKTRSVPVLANAMSVTLNENYGQLQVTDSVNGKMLSKVYVKTYVLLANGTVKFHKDGYTDQRGKFDYASVSTPEASPITKFGILVLSETQGALIREVAPPQQ
jgi:hypothetical protein